MYLLFDIGGTKTRLALSNGHKIFNKIKIIKTPSDFGQAIDLISQKAQELNQGKKFKAAYGGVPGPLNQAKSKLLNAPNLPGWVDKSLQKKLSDKLKVSVFLENDAALAGLGEAHYGVGKAKKNIAYLTISTGIGGAKIVNGQIDQNSFGFEPGHQIINFSGSKNERTLEQNISGAYLAKKYKKPAYQIQSQKVWYDEARLLAYGLNNITVLWSPELIILGGSLMKSIKLVIVKQYFKKSVKIFNKLPSVKKAKLGDLAGLYGSLSLINQK